MERLERTAGKEFKIDDTLLRQTKRDNLANDRVKVPKPWEEGWKEWVEFTRKQQKESESLAMMMVGLSLSSDANANPDHVVSRPSTSSNFSRPGTSFKQPNSKKLVIDPTPFFSYINYNILKLVDPIIYYNIFSFTTTPTPKAS